jgi:Kdo-III transferase WaaZ
VKSHSILNCNWQYSASDFADCRNIAKGAVFIIASGSSAKDFPIERFADIPMITMNGAISMFAKTDIRPFFYACTDLGFPRQQPELFTVALKLSQHVALWKDQLDALPVVPAGRVFPLKKVRDPSLLEALVTREKGLIRNRAFWGKRSRSLGFSKDLSLGFFDARTVAYLALQIAYHVGFTKVFLVGVDLNQSVGRFYETGKVAVSPCGLDQHFPRRILPSLQLMANKVMGDQFAVYNLSPTSRIPKSVIPKIGLDDVEALLRHT